MFETDRRELDRYSPTVTRESGKSSVSSPDSRFREMKNQELSPDPPSVPVACSAGRGAGTGFGSGAGVTAAAGAACTTAECNELCGKSGFSGCTVAGGGLAPLLSAGRGVLAAAISSFPISLELALSLGIGIAGRGRGRGSRFSIGAPAETAVSLAALAFTTPSCC